MAHTKLIITAQSPDDAYLNDASVVWEGASVVWEGASVVWEGAS